MLLFGHSYAGSTDGGGDDFVQRGVADHDFMQFFGRIAADHEQLGHGDEVGYAVADGCDAREGVAGPYDLHESAGSPGCLREVTNILTQSLQ